MPQPTAVQETPGARQIARATALEKERATLAEKITKNRTYLRLMDDNGELSDDESVWLEAFYPTKEKGTLRSKEEIEETRKIKAAARAK